MTDGPSRSKWMRDGSLGHKEGAESEVGAVGTWWAIPYLTDMWPWWVVLSWKVPKSGIRVREG